MKRNDPFPYNSQYRPSPPRRSSPPPRKNGSAGWLLFSVLVVIAGVCVIFFTKPYWDGSRDSAAEGSPSVSSSLPTDSTDIPVAASSPSSDVISTDSSTEGMSTPQPMDAAARENARAELELVLQNLLGQKLGRYGLYYLNLETGESIEIHARDPFVAASSIKLAYNTYLYQKALGGSFSLDDQMAYNSAAYPDGDFEAGTGNIQNDANGTLFTLSEISHRSIYLSDNCGTNMILRKLGGIETVNQEYMMPISAVVNYRGKVEYTDFRGAAQSGRNRTSAMDLALYAKNLYSLYQGNKEGYQPLIDDLSSSSFSWGISAVTPPSGEKVTVAHKIGFNTAYATNNDAGIVFGEEDYILAIVTENNSDTEAQLVIGQASQLVYDYIRAVTGNT